MRKLYYTFGKKNIMQMLIFTLFILFFFGPLLNLIMLAFTDNYDYPMFFPKILSLRWWQFILARQDLVSSMFLSFFIAIVATLLSLIICIPGAYAFARFNFPFKRLFLFSFLVTNAFPKIGLYISIAVLFYKLNLMGTFLGVILIHILNTLMYMTWIPAGAFRSVHKQQEEAARDVGANALQTFWHVTLPLAAPGILVASIFTFLGSLEEAQGTLIIGAPKYKTIPVMMYGVVSDYPPMAGAVFAIILVLPTLLLLFFARKKTNGGDAMASGFKMK